jgi:apolipoprotein N-acyltransferase
MAGPSPTVRGPANSPAMVMFVTLIAGFWQAAATGWPFSAGLALGQTLWWLQTAAMAAWMVTALHAATPAIAARRAWAFATVWLSSTFWWLFVAMNTYGGLPVLLSAIAVIALAGALGAYYALAVWLWRKLPTSNPAMVAAAFGVLWMMAELARGTWLTGFGWGAIGYAHVDGPLAYFLPWIGSYGVSALAATWSASIGIAILYRRWVQALLVSALLLLPSLLPASWNSWTAPSQTLAVTLLQGNIQQDEKFEPGSGVPLALQWYQQALEQATGDLVVAPETAIPLLPQQLPDGYWDALVARFGHGQQSALIGIPLGSFQAGYTNSVIGITPGAAQGWRYDKHHLVPFGEFIPPLFKWFTQLMNIPLGDFNRGPLGQPSLEVRGERVAPNICYEDLYGEELATRFVDPAHAPTIFANVSNLGWFNDTVALQQHLNISRVRALEFQRPFARATNTGATAILSHEGQVLDMLPPLTRGVLHGSVEGRTGMTPFAWWASRFGLWPLWIVGLGLLALLWRLRRRT